VPFLLLFLFFDYGKKYIIYGEADFKEFGKVRAGFKTGRVGYIIV